MCDFPMNNPSWAEYQTSIEMPSWAEAPYVVEIVFLGETTIVSIFNLNQIGWMLNIVWRLANIWRLFQFQQN